ncbi:2',3'-cyclic-nucleotide 2'-phosphodiesterase / 3'-nucleotidase [Proteiniborus ethanoligenes]|uniref:2',3'-cyclic-nucleotide 2'-phosphodiesterase / 3'-nucleotidase n=1 Tax=Proteiniborus ethanoligenes TaxID=415015 RepID=A0A1H3LSK9_9FIRM|nr:5'-nucleotidase C-terminal domain-containing protein [Proteiniborus ethanoligenes]SDY67004.1 2',3'-cyclic-nucleotide 2'-phosphodiesterase / 3'-nucleotidase [Proteiniborus ethanoligenes]
MKFKTKKILSLIVTLSLLLGIFVVPAMANAEDTVKITILGTTDVHGNIYNWSYEDAKANESVGLAKVFTVVQKVREENPNTILLDNGDTIQGTVLTDDLYNVNLDEPNPVIAAMNFMGYDAMTLGNHEFNFGLDLVNKIIEEAEFPMLSANTYKRADDTHYVKPYIVKEIAGVKVGILGLTTPSIPRWDGAKVDSLYFTHMAEEAEKQIKLLKETEKVDIIIATAHSGLESRHEEDGGDAVKLVIERNPEIEAMLIGHDHESIARMEGNVAIGAARDQGRQVVRIDLTLQKDGEGWKVIEKTPSLIEVVEFEASEELKEHTKVYHEATLEFLKETLGVATDDFHPASEVKGIPEAQVRDTAVIDLINTVQLKYTGADIAAAALFKNDSNIRKGNISFNNIFDIYKYPNTLVGVEVTGKELKAYMEWSAAYYNTYKPGDVTISFNPNIRGYNYDMFAGVEYKVDISKPVGERIVDLVFKGNPVKEDDVFKLAINNYRYSGMKDMGIINGEAYLETDPISLRSYIADYIKEQGTISPEVDNNWSVVGADLNHPLRDYIIEQVNKGEIQVPVSQDGRTPNVKALNVYELAAEGKIPAELAKEHGLLPTEEPAPEPIPAPAPVEEPKVEVPAGQKYTVKAGDVLWKIAEQFGLAWEKLAEFNSLKNPHLIFPGQEILIP